MVTVVSTVTLLTVILIIKYDLVQSEYAAISEFSHTIGLYEDSDSLFIEDIFYCTGVIINKKFGLAAAHCLNIVEYATCMQQEKSGWKPDGYHWSPIVRVIRYDPNAGFNHDIGVIEFKRDMFMCIIDNFISLPIKGRKYRNESSLIATGYHRKGDERNLQKTSVYLFDPQKCQTAAESYNISYSEDKVCVYEPQNSQDWLDFTGPVYYENKVLAGFHSFHFNSYDGDGIERFPVMLTMVEDYLDWIRDTTRLN